MGRASRTKGSSGELEVVHILKGHGYETWRTPNSGAFTHSRGDIRGMPGLHWEIKRQERLEMDKWTAQAEADCASTDMPLVAYRRSRQPWRVVSLLEDFLVIYKRSEM
jgi:Holliday junction resolvase